MKPNDARADKKELRWRHDLLSSSIQLEYKVARRVVGQGFSATADYTYARVVNGVEKEYSVDILAQQALVHSKDEFTVGDIKLLLECKYRRPGVSWLFLPEVDSSSPLRKPILRTVADYSNICELNRSPDIALPNCYKGVEIDLIGRDTNRVSDQELRHGLEQLQYGLIPLMKEIVLDAAFSLEFDEDSSPPVFVLPVLVTTAPLFIASSDFDAIDIKTMESLDQFATEIPALTIDMVLGTQIKAEALRYFANLREGGLEEIFKKLDETRKSQPKRMAATASYAFRMLTNASGLRVNSYLSRVAICNVEHFEEVLSLVNSVVRERVAKAKKLIAVEPS